MSDNSTPRTYEPGQKVVINSEDFASEIDRFCIPLGTIGTYVEGTASFYPHRVRVEHPEATEPRAVLLRDDEVTPALPADFHRGETPIYDALVARKYAAKPIRFDPDIYED